MSKTPDEIYIQQLPFATTKGYWNPDMFEDWYNAKPTKADEQLWQFLHSWEQNITDRKMDELLIKLRVFVEELS